MSYLATLAVVPELEAGKGVGDTFKKIYPLLEFMAVTSPTWILFFYGY